MGNAKGGLGRILQLLPGIKSIPGLFFHCFVGQFLKIGQKIRLGSGEKLMLILHEKRRCSVFLQISGLCLLSIS